VPQQVAHTRAGTLEAPIRSDHFPKEAGIHHNFVIALPVCQHGRTTGHCWKRVLPNLPLVLKTRTMTSDSMDHLNNPQAVIYGDNNARDKRNVALLLWVNET
jgi:hypothetical protein